jgi:glycosyltransferase involved in cell wall biosynthesis
LKIIYDHQIFCAQKAGGISRYFNEIIKRAAAEPDVSASVFLGFYANDYIDTATLRGIVSLPRLKCKQFRGIRHANRLLWEPWVKVKSCDIYHPTYYGIFGAPRKSKVVLSVYDFIDERFRRDNPGRKKFIEQKKAATRKADLLLCISKQTQSDLIELCGVDPSKTRVTYLGASEVFSPNYAKRENVILYVGSREDYKNYSILKAVYEGTPWLYENFKLVCFGGPRPSPAEIPVNGEFIYAFGDDILLASYYRRAAVFVYPSLYEGFGLPLIEALRSACPVVATRGGGSISEIASEYVSYFDPASYDDLSNCLCRVLSESLRIERQKAGVNYASGFIWDRCWNDTLAAYKSIL